MTTREDLERVLYRAITGNRLGASSHNVPTALRELGRRFKEPWKVAGISRRQWQRWMRGDAKPSPRSQAGLLAALRRLRFSKARETRMRGSAGIHVTATDNYEDYERHLGASSFDWSGAQTTENINAVLDAYLTRGIGAAVDAWLAAAPRNAGWAQEWLHPDSNGSSQSMDLDSIDFTGNPPHAGRGARRRRR